MFDTHRPRSRNEFEIAIICALRLERNAVQALLDEEYETDGRSYGKVKGDRNTYSTGRLGKQHVVVAHMSGIGTISAAAVAASLVSSFQGVRVAFLVGICGGTPMTPDGEEVLLGDVLVSTTVVQIDFGRQYPDKFVRKTDVEDTLGRQTPEIRGFVAKISDHSAKQRLRDKTTLYAAGIASKKGFSSSVYPGPEHDVLHAAEYRHKHRRSRCGICDKCKTNEDRVCDVALGSSCDNLGCTGIPLRERKRLQAAMGIAPNGRQVAEIEAKRAQNPAIHFGRVACANQVMKSGVHRDRLAIDEKVIGFEMESAGVWDYVPTIVVKSVSDYADSHKSDRWQTYAAATAAACTKAILEEWRNTDNLPPEGTSPEEAKSHKTSHGPRNQTLELYRTRAPKRKMKDEETLHESFQHYKYGKVYQRHVLEQHRGTGNWIEKHEMYRRWFDLSNDKYSILWLSGEKGCGKTVLVSSLIAKLRAQSGTKTSPECVTLYSLYDRRYNATGSSMLCVMIHQLVAELPHLRTVLYDRYRSISRAVKKHHQRPSTQLWWVLHELIKNIVSVKLLYVVLDGFDFLNETSQRSFLQGWKDLRVPVKFLVAGRDMADAERLASAMFQDQKSIGLKLDLLNDSDAIQAVKCDIDNYTMASLSDTQRYAFLSRQEKMEIFKTLRGCEDTTFLATTLHLNMIELERGTDRVLNDQLSTLPTSSDAIFVNLFTGLRSVFGARSDLTLRYLLFGFEDFTVDEIAYASGSQGDTDADDGRDGFRRMLLQFRPMVVIHKRSCRVALCHPSARERLLQLVDYSADEAWKSLNQRLSHQIFAIECLARLLQTQNLQLPGTHRDNYATLRKEAIDRHPLLWYALKWWNQHLRAACSAPLGSDKVSQRLRQMLSDLSRFWMRQDEESVTLRHLMIDIGGVQYLTNVRISSPFELNCALGLTGRVQEMLSEKVNSIRFQARIAAALSAAIRGGHTCTVEMLIERYSVKSLDGDTYSNILQDVVRRDQPALLNLVLKLRKRDTNELDNALSAAIQMGNSDMFNSLKKEIDAQGKSGSTATALHAMFRIENRRDTSATVKEAIVKINVLVEGGVIDINASEPLMGNTALHLACWFDFNTEIVNALIDKGADPKKPNRFGWTPLHLAARYNRSGTTVEALLRIGGSELAGLLTNGGSSPLHWAAESGCPAAYHRFEAAAKLLEAGANPHLANDKGITPTALAVTLLESPRRLSLPYIQAVKAKDAFLNAKMIGAGVCNLQLRDTSSDSELDLESRRELKSALSSLPYVDSDPEYEETIAARTHRKRYDLLAREQPKREPESTSKMRLLLSRLWSPKSR